MIYLTEQTAWHNGLATQQLPKFMDNQALFSFILTISLLPGLGIGFFTYRSNFCFASMFRKIILFWDSPMLRILLVCSGHLSCFMFQERWPENQSPTTFSPALKL
jgi:hypothetical protein